MEGLDLENILDEDEIASLFDNNTTQESSEEEDTDNEENKDKNNNTAEVDPDEIFGEPESVGSEDKTGDEEDAPIQKNGVSSDFFSSIANAFAEEGIFPDLDEETIKGIKTADDFRKAIDAQIQAGLDEQQRRIAEALDNNVQPDEIRQNEGLLHYLNNIAEDAISAETTEGENLRKQLIYQDYINRGFSESRAEKETKRSIDNGTDLEDAKDALESCKIFYKEKYDSLINERKAETKRIKEAQEQQVKELHKSLMNDSFKFFEGIDLDKNTRQMAYDAVTKPVYKDPKTGNCYTAVQKLEMENPMDFSAKLGLLYAVTDGFKSLDKFVNRRVKKEMKKGFSELENTFNSTSRDLGGNLRFTSGVSDSESYIGKNMKLDI